ncbi:MAG TPA: chemotaxis protein CheA [Marinospirillum sp.]|uniref:chemotaxis protein CheA n=1 Tax=Marinospirillum sp. TaxID=2183934 RepID=UPI002B45ECC0|nr:chemotaxis protein CheA [Marinospirillum sp.]HKM16421.1 chemotaxis protein CheA [Marinospirillum sp.]
MSLDADQDILQDFLVEAGEILELLSEQLVDLEQSPNDPDLLNAIFRGFHTVKGGAGFLQITPLVECCHNAENVFDTLRKNQRQVTPELMDVVLSALDAVNEMFETVRANEMPGDADEALLEALAYYAYPEGEEVGSAPGAESAESEFELAEVIDNEQESESVDGDGDGDGDITDAEFESLLNALSPEDRAAMEKEAKVPAAPVARKSYGPPSDDISEDEFDALLDELHGKGKGPGLVAEKPKPKRAAKPPPSDNITEDEFDALLDELHGKGKAPNFADAGSAKPAIKPVTKPAAKSIAPESTAALPAVAAKTPARKEPLVDTTVRVDTSRLDEIMNMVGELVLVRNRLVRLGSDSSDAELAKAVGNLDVVTADLQSAVMKTRMQPIKKVFGRFPRVVRDLSRSMKKEMVLEMIGEDTDLDKNLVEALADPLVHLVRNSADHGIEMPDVREKNGKDRVGKIVLSAEQEGDHILLIIADDGAGMDPEVLKRKAVEKGQLDQDAADRLTDQEAFNLIFAAGLSTKDEISDVSGRGVGMDVVKTKISQLNGTLNVWSELGKGSKIIIKVPLTLAIMPTLMIKLQDQTFALPLVNVDEIFQLDVSRANKIDGHEVIIIRDRTLPLFYLRRWLVRDPAKREISKEEMREAHVVVVAIGNMQVGFVVDDLIGQEEVVIKPLGTMLHGTPGLAGATITGDGRIALILDIPGLLNHYTGRR